MIRFLSLLLGVVASIPALAHERVVDSCAVQEPATCAAVFDLPGLSLQGADPVVLPDGTLRLLAASPDGLVELVDVSTADGSVLRRQAVDLRLDPDRQFWDTAFAVFAADGQTLVIAATEKGEEWGLRLFDADGALIGFLPETELEANFLPSSIILEDWGYETSSAGLFLLLLAQDLVGLQGHELTGTLYRFELVADLRAGTFALRETYPAKNEGDSFLAYMERRFRLQLDPVGSDVRRYLGDLAAVTTTASDGSAPIVYVMDRNEHRVFYDQHLGVENGRFFEYFSARISPDAEHLGVVRSSSSDADGPPFALMVFKTVTAEEVFVAALPEMDWNSRVRVVWLSEGRVAVLLTDEEDGIRGIVFDLPTGD
jgi:hypothetical protein